MALIEDSRVRERPRDRAYLKSLQPNRHPWRNASVPVFSTTTLSPGLELADLELENVELGRRIAAKKGSLDLKSKLAKISASAVTHTQAVSISGSSAQLDLNLNHAPL